MISYLSSWKEGEGVSKQIPELAGLKDTQQTHIQIDSRIVSKQIPELAGLKDT